MSNQSRHDIGILLNLGLALEGTVVKVNGYYPVGSLYTLV